MELVEKRSVELKLENARQELERFIGEGHAMDEAAVHTLNKMQQNTKTLEQKVESLSRDVRHDTPSGKD